MSNPIIGKTIVALEIAEDRQALRFVLEDAECIESNGYYGGNLVWPDADDSPYYYGGVFGQNVSNNQWGPVR